MAVIALPVTPVALRLLRAVSTISQQTVKVPVRRSAPILLLGTEVALLVQLPSQRLRALLLAVYIACVTAAFLYFNMRLTIEWVALILFVAALVSGRGLLFVRDWGVFIAVLLAWQLTSGLAARFSFPWHLTELISADKAMFAGSVPPLWLQQHLYHPGKLEPWDVFAATMYMLHFLTPLACGFVLWMTNRDLFRKFALAFILVALAGFATYILYPAVPPWMAAQPLVHFHDQYLLLRDMHLQPGQHVSSHVYLPGVRNLFNVFAANWYNPYHGNIRIGIFKGSYDNVGAIPSEHAAYPMLFFLFLRRQFGRPAYLALVYIAGLLFSITYLGQHYVIDAIVGFAYAFVGYALVMHAYPALHNRVAALLRGDRPAALRARAELEEA
ncbi:MAG: phosphatase PAP2 family protein [Chloroflexota bacterium]